MVLLCTLVLSAVRVREEGFSDAVATDEFLQNDLDCFILACYHGHRILARELITKYNMNQHVVNEVCVCVCLPPPPPPPPTHTPTAYALVCLLWETLH